MTPIQVVLVDGHSLIRAGMRALLTGMTGVAVVGEAVDSDQALLTIRALRPQVAVVDVAFPRRDGVQLVQRLTAEHPRTGILIVSVDRDDAHIRDAIEAGVSGYLLKEAGVEEFETALKTIARGDRYFSDAVLRTLATAWDGVQAIGAEVEDRLTPRQREIVRLIAEGKTTKAIANALNLSVKTVETHRTQLKKRLHINDMAGLIRYAIRLGLVPREE